MDESDAIARLKRGDISGLETLVRKYQLQAVRAAYLIVRDVALAEDIVQSAFLRAYQRIDQFDATKPFGPWFLRSVVNDARKLATRAARLTALPDGTQDPSISIDDLLAAAETEQALSAALALLSPGQRQAIVLRYYLDMSESEMAAALKIAPGTVKWRLHVARQRLRRLLPAWLRPAREDYEQD